MGWASKHSGWGPSGTDPSVAAMANAISSYGCFLFLSFWDDGLYDALFRQGVVLAVYDFGPDDDPAENVTWAPTSAPIRAGD